MNEKRVKTYRSAMLVASVAVMLFAGIIYAWSILKVPFMEDFGWTNEQLTLNYTFTMCSFCLGGLFGGFALRKIGAKWSGLAAALLAGSGLILTGLLNGENVTLLYLTYALMGGFGIGFAYNVMISTVSAWFPDKKGFSTGCMLMGFGASSLLLGKLVDFLFKTSLGRCGTFVVFGGALLVILSIVSLFLKPPTEKDALPVANKKATANQENSDKKEYSTKEMLCRFSFWRAFLLLILCTAVGNSVISFARDLALSTGAKAAFATTLVGVLAVCNGCGRILTGTLFDILGRKKTMFLATTLTVIAAGVTLLSVVVGSLPLCIVGLCLTGFSYATCPIMVTALASSFYGQKYFASNFSMMNCNLIVASFIATACSRLLTAFGGYIAPFVLLLALSVVAWLLNLTLKRP